jgi:RHS repeat-associated protein
MYRRFLSHRAYDALGLVRMVTDANGDVVAQLEYGAWGELLDGSFDSVPGGMPFGFVGALGVRNDALTGLVYMRNRHYDPSLGRFLNQDPIGFAGGLNLFTYVDNNPTTMVDPHGLEPSTGLTRALGYRAEIINAAQKYRVPREVIAAALAHEMEWGGIQAPKRAVAGWVKNPWDVSTGIAQIKPSTAKYIDEQTGQRVMGSAEAYQAILNNPSEQIDYLTRNLLLAKKKVDKRMPRTHCKDAPEGAKKNLKWIVIIDSHNNAKQQYLWEWNANYDGQVWQDLQDAYEAFGRR